MYNITALWVTQRDKLYDKLSQCSSSQMKVSSLFFTFNLSLSLSPSPSLHLHNSHFAVKMRAKITCSFLSSLNLNFLVALESSDKKLQLIFASGNKYRIEPELVLFWFQFLQFCWQRETSERILNQSLHLHKYWVLEK